MVQNKDTPAKFPTLSIWDVGFRNADLNKIPNPKSQIPNRLTVAWAVPDSHRLPLQGLSEKDP
jgi:hypothetical protein